MRSVAPPPARSGSPGSGTGRPRPGRLGVPRIRRAPLRALRKVAHLRTRPWATQVADFAARSLFKRIGRHSIRLQATAPEPGPNAIQPCEPGDCSGDVLVAHASKA